MLPAFTMERISNVIFKRRIKALITCMIGKFVQLYKYTYVLRRKNSWQQLHLRETQWN